MQAKKTDFDQMRYDQPLSALMADYKYSIVLPMNFLSKELAPYAKLKSGHTKNEAYEWQTIGVTSHYTNIDQPHIMANTVSAGVLDLCSPYPTIPTLNQTCTRMSEISGTEACSGTNSLNFNMSDNMESSEARTNNHEILFGDRKISSDQLTYKSSGSTKSLDMLDLDKSHS